MIEIARDLYLNKLIEREFDGLVKIVTGIRRCGKSYLLFKLFREYLIKKGINEDHIIEVNLENDVCEDLRDRKALYEHIKSCILDNGNYYILIDEIQYIEGFAVAVNWLRNIPNVDIYITGSNSKFLSLDIATEFRGRSERIHVYPLSFAEYLSVYDGTAEQAWDEYMRYGGMPESVKYSPSHKEEYLLNLIESVYLLDITERNDIRNSEFLNPLMSALCSSVGSLTNVKKITDTMSTVGGKKIDRKTVVRYLEILQDSFLFERAQRYDVKGRKYFDSICKYYVVDIGLRNAWLGYRQQESTHLMENIIYNELRMRGYSVDVGVVPIRVASDDENKNDYVQLEIDFIANKGNDRFYIQSAYSIESKEKHEQEIRPFLKSEDSFRKFIIVGGSEKPWVDENGVTTVGILRFLTDDTFLR